MVHVNFEEKKEYWRARIREIGLAQVEVELESLHGIERDAASIAVQEYKQEQEDTKNAPREQREVDMERHARHSKWAAIIAAIAAVVASAISVIALIVALPAKGG